MQSIEGQFDSSVP
nr:unnamed protein product [Callosobruchus chinensis]